MDFAEVLFALCCRCCCGIGGMIGGSWGMMEWIDGMDSEMGWIVSSCWVSDKGKR